MIIKREEHEKALSMRLKNFPVTAILGPRQCGKSTLAREFSCVLRMDLENPEDLMALENPLQLLKQRKGLVVIDEVQRRPELFPTLRYLVDENPKLKFLLLGSASRDLLRQSSETLAGRISYYHLSGFSLPEVGDKNLKKLWFRGGFPKAFLAKSTALSLQWRQDYISTFLERDLPQLGIQVPALTIRRFWSLLAHYNGQVLNYSEIGRSFGISDTVVRKYLDILAGTFMVHLIAPWHANISKRQIKSPKFYFSDTGLFHSLLRLEDEKSLLSHPRLGSSWESFVLSQLKFHYSNEFYFWRTHAGAEIDFLMETPKGLIGFEAKFSDAPKLTPSMHQAMEDLGLKKIFVIYPGTREYDLAKNIHVLPLEKLHSLSLSRQSFHGRK